MFNSTPVSLPSACRWSRERTTSYSVGCSSGRVGEHVQLAQFCQRTGVSLHQSPTRGTVCAHVQCGLGCSSLLYISLLDSVLIIDVITYHLVWELLFCRHV